MQGFLGGEGGGLQADTFTAERCSSHWMTRVDTPARRPAAKPANKTSPPKRIKMATATHLCCWHCCDCVLPVRPLLLCVCAPTLVASWDVEGHLHESVLPVISCIVYMELKQHLVLQKVVHILRGRISIVCTILVVCSLEPDPRECLPCHQLCRLRGIQAAPHPAA